MITTDKTDKRLTFIRLLLSVQDVFMFTQFNIQMFFNQCY